MSENFTCRLNLATLTKLVEAMKTAGDGELVTVEDGPDNWYCSKEVRPRGLTTVRIEVYRNVGKVTQ
jgi:hypothetical protein